MACLRISAIALLTFFFATRAVDVEDCHVAPDLAPTQRHTRSTLFQRDSQRCRQELAASSCKKTKLTEASFALLWIHIMSMPLALLPLQGESCPSTLQTGRAQTKQEHQSCFSKDIERQCHLVGQQFASCAFFCSTPSIALSIGLIISWKAILSESAKHDRNGLNGGTRESWAWLLLKQNVSRIFARQLLYVRSSDFLVECLWERFRCRWQLIAVFVWLSASLEA
eukprot:3032080-Amphidinium_carterae.2